MGTHVVDPVFRPIPTQKAYFTIWRIEQLKLVAVPKPQWGNFYRGDAYLLYSARETRGALDQQIHFWLGADCSQDEAGVAAIKTVELDDYLGGAAIQHREVEGNESKEFVSYFRKGIRYTEGGVRSGLNHVDRNHWESKLYQVKGKRNPRCKEVALAWSSFNSGDVFLHDQGPLVFVWNGSESNREERIKAMEIARGLRDERKGASLVILEEGEELELQGKQKELWENGDHLSLSKRSVARASSVPDDREFERKAAEQIRLYRCTDEGGTLRVIEVSNGPLHYNMLDNKDVFIVDNGNAGVFVWCGKNSNQNEKRAAMSNAINFVEKLGRHSKSVQVTKINELCESTTFKQLFRGWPAAAYSGKVYTNNKVAKTIQTKFDASTMHENRQLAAETRMVDDGSGEVQIWRVENMELVPLDSNLHGQFFGGDSYVILYTYYIHNRQQHIIYYWQGRKSSQDEKGAVALHATALDTQLGGGPVQVRVVQGKEPAHFLAMFKGKMIVFDGGKAGWSKEDKDQAIGETFLLRVHGTNALNTKAEQVPTAAASLNSNDSFVLVSRQQIFIWCGKGTTGDEREMAKNIAKSISRRDYTLLSEGQDNAAFWSLLGGKAEYMSDKRLRDADPEFECRLFQISNAKGYVYAEEIYDFIQQDLVSDDVMLLDTFEEMYLWIGTGANEIEKQGAVDTAREYVSTDPSQSRDENTPIFTIKQGYEPPTFTGFFPAWDFSLWSKHHSYEEMKRQCQDSNVLTAVPDTAEEVTNGFQNLTFSDYKKIDYATLRDSPPSFVRIDERELHLSEDEFEHVFGMTYAKFTTLPPWKQTLKKKEVHLF